MSIVLNMRLMAPLTEAELVQLVQGYSDEKLAELYRTARAHPGTDWVRRLSAEIGRRDALGLFVA